MIGGICATYIQSSKKLGYKTQAQWGQTYNELALQGRQNGFLPIV